MHASFSYFHLFCCPVLQWSARLIFSPLPPLLCCSLSASFCRSEVQGRLFIPQITLQRGCKSLLCRTGKDSKGEENSCCLEHLSSCQILQITVILQMWPSKVFKTLLVSMTFWTVKVHKTDILMNLKCPPTDGAHISDQCLRLRYIYIKVCVCVYLLFLLSNE